MRKNIILCGVGGQGIVLTSKLLAASAMAKGIPVMSAETIGMAQKGGSVFSFLRMGDDLCCPMFPKGTADLLIGFEPAEAVRMLPYLKPDGTVTLLDGDAACREIGSPKVLNMVMLGAVLRSDVLPLTLEEVTETMERTVKPQFRELNRKALHIQG